MVRRSICSISILLLCIIITSCGKVDRIDSSNKEDVANNPPVKDVDTMSKEVQEVLPFKEAENIKYKETLEDIEKKEMVEASQEEAEEALEEKKQIRLYPAGTILDTEGYENLGIESLFYSEEISEAMKERISGKSYGENCDVPYSELRYIRVLHIGFDGLSHIGEVIVNKSIAEDIVVIFKELYELNYPIERMVLVEEYNADDITSMEANNSSSFNFRNIDGTKKRSLHGDGMAIDINPLYNPFIREIDGKIVVQPESGTEYADRTKECPYYIKEGDPCWLAFTERGFTWGGDWKNQKDYQHFEIKQWSRVRIYE